MKLCYGTPKFITIVEASFVAKYPPENAEYRNIITRKITSWYGLMIGKLFLGVMVWDSPKYSYEPKKTSN